MSLKNVSAVCDRYGTSDRESAAIVSAAFQDLGVINNDDKSLVVDRHKLRRARQKTRRKVLNPKISTFVGLFFDGRKDQTLVQTNVNGKTKNVKKLEEHITLINEPGSNFMGHIAISLAGTAANITNKILNFIDKNKIVTKDWCAIGCDGTNCNTGWKSGIIRCIELKLKKQMQWIVCLLHANELPFRHLFIYLDGKTSGPNAFTGPIGKNLKQSMSLEVVKFKTIPANLPVIFRNTLLH